MENVWLFGSPREMQQRLFVDVLDRPEWEDYLVDPTSWMGTTGLAEGSVPDVACGLVGVTDCVELEAEVDGLKERAVGVARRSA